MRDDAAPGLGGLLRLAGRPIRLGGLLGWVGRHKVGVLLGLGVVFRVAQYLDDRPYWLDEHSLWANIARMTWSGLTAPLIGTQLAPPGFLAVEWAALRGLGDSRWALRMVPLLGGVASLFLFARAAGRCLRPSAVPIAVALFAVSDDLIYFASELKQYSTDVTAALGCLLAGLATQGRPVSRVRLAGLAAMGATVVWFSHPSAFVLAGVGTVLLASAVVGRRWREAAGLGLACLAWGASFATVLAVAGGQTGHRRDLWAFWAFAFPPGPFGDPTWWPRRFVYLFDNPLGLGSRLAALPAIALFFAGCGSGRWADGPGRRRFWMVAAPGLFAAGAASLHRYPFHGRLVLFLVPSLLLFIAEGAARVGEAWGGRRLARSALLATLLLAPAGQACYHLAVPRRRVDFNSRGDNRPERPGPDAPLFGARMGVRRPLAERAGFG